MGVNELNRDPVFRRQMIELRSAMQNLNGREHQELIAVRSTDPAEPLLKPLCLRCAKSLDAINQPCGKMKYIKNKPLDVEGNAAWKGSSRTVDRYHEMESLTSTVMNIPAVRTPRALTRVVKDTHPPNSMVYPNVVMRVPEINVTRRAAPEPIHGLEATDIKISHVK
ncbi:hypothetical protein MMC12_001279 [Toensbergia leucococca]|nr:hypothetical protein [Toensbergia leucococca]